MKELKVDTPSLKQRSASRILMFWHYVTSITLMAFVFAEFIAAYTLFYSTNIRSLYVVAGVLSVDAALRAGRAFTKQ